MHKCYFAAITWSAELNNSKQEFLKIHTCSNDDIFFRLIESVSDLGSSLFNWANGNYKASKVMLRISIENFIKATSAIECKAQLTEKSVYKIFDIASDLLIFSDAVNPRIRTCYEALHGDYKLLCEDVHTATTHNMGHLTSLADLPAFHIGKSSNTADIYIRVSKNITSIFCILFNSFFHQMHHRNRENILNCLNRNLRSAILAPQG
tara:strand:- start:405 stop:1025 length:621 start_codon:yes stop_codon:yes gene_type:complete